MTALGVGVGVGLVVAVSARSNGLDKTQGEVLKPLTGVGYSSGSGWATVPTTSPRSCREGSSRGWRFRGRSRMAQRSAG